MFEYDLAGKQVILVLDKEILPDLKFVGIEGSPLFAKVYKMEEEGLWLDNPSFTVCPIGVPKIIKSPDGEPVCSAHVFVPAKAVVSVVVFPQDAGHFSEDPNLHQIGFQVGEKKGS